MGVIAVFRLLPNILKTHLMAVEISAKESIKGDMRMESFCNRELRKVKKQNHLKGRRRGSEKKFAIYIFPDIRSLKSKCSA